MIIIKNARCADGKLYTLALASGHIAELVQQEKLEPSSPGELGLERFAELSGDPAWVAAQKNQWVNAHNALLVPAAIDAHVHSRDPGFPDKEDWMSLAQAALRGGVVGLVDMPNTFPPTLTRDEVLEKAQRAEKSGLAYRFLLGVNGDNLSSLPKLLSEEGLPICGLKIYYGNSTGNLQFDQLDTLAAQVPQPAGSMLVFHAEDQCCIDRHTRALSDQRDYASVGQSYAIHSQIRDSDSALQATAAILRWAKRWGRAVHIAHVSTPDEVDLIRAARADGLRVTGEVCPHHLLLSLDDYERLGGFLKVNPPVRSFREMQLLQGAFASGSFDCFVTDHAPHTREEKLRPYAECPSGMPGIEFYWPLFYQICRISGASLAELLPMVGINPARLFGFSRVGALAAGMEASFVWLEQQHYTVGSDDVRARCGWSPYVGMNLEVRVQATWQGGLCRYNRQTEEKACNTQT